MRRSILIPAAIALLLTITPEHSFSAAPDAPTRAVLIAGGGAGGEGSPALEAKLAQPFGVLHDPAGQLVIVEFASGLRAIDPAGKLVTLAGDGTKGDTGDGGPAKAAKLNAPHAIAVGPDDALYIADTYNHRVRRIDPKTNVITTFAGGDGGPKAGFAGDNGPADQAQFNELYCIAMTPNNDRMVVTDLGNRRIRAIDMKTRIVTTIAGNGQKGVPADGARATEAPLVDPRAAAMDFKGNCYILERAGHALRVVDASGKIRTLIPGPKDGRQRHHRRHRQPQSRPLVPRRAKTPPPSWHGQKGLRRRRRPPRPTPTEPTPRRLPRPRRPPVHQRQHEQPGAADREVT
jgi:DNA-binding beta-propeller fold protein YncE